MGKHEPPPFKMVIERGKLIPATPYDAERLDSYRNGVRVNVRFTEDRDRVMVKKWWAVLGRAVKECKTPWQNKEQASEAIKLALGIVNLSKTVGGDFMAYPKSLTELDDPELTEAVERMIDVIYHVTGVDVSVWRKHVENIRDDEPSEVVAPSSDVGSDEASSPGQIAADQTEPVGGTGEADDIEAREEPDASSASDLVIRNLMVECLDKFMALAVDSSVPDAKQRRANVEFAKNTWKEALPARLGFVKACFETADKMVKGELKADVARRYLESML
ncbi:hypothetical protein NKH61_05400 [Mesorhizobium sp. M1005]|uniref:hypothetical protein n=1 Tax=unclassified Mesorhizobium TaxID=325217 RepID=UPI0033371F25